MMPCKTTAAVSGTETHPHAGADFAGPQSVTYMHSNTDSADKMAAADVLQ